MPGTHEPWLEDDELFEPILPRRPELDPDEWETDVSLDTSDVRLEDPDLWGPSEPDWVIREKYVDMELGIIKTGKEADVSLVRRTSGDRSCLLAMKRYRPRTRRAFRREEAYREGTLTNDVRVNRAIANRSRFGRSILEYAWAYREFPLMRTAWEVGVRVPYPVEMLEDGFVMQYIGDEERAAPRLAECRLGREEAAAVFEDVVDGIRRLLDAYLVHGDLSAFNILYWHGRAWFIDFPQATDVVRSPRGPEFLRRDVSNVCAFFERFGVERDEQLLFEDVVLGARFPWPEALMA